MYIPHMSGIPGHDGHIPVIHINNLKIPRIQTFKIFPAKHLLPPSQIPFQRFLHDLLHCSSIHLCKILLIQFYRQLHRYALWILLFFTRQNILNRLFRNVLSIFRSSTACFGFSFYPSASATCWIIFCIFTFR